MINRLEINWLKNYFKIQFQVNNFKQEDIKKIKFAGRLCGTIG